MRSPQEYVSIEFLHLYVFFGWQNHMRLDAMTSMSSCHWQPGRRGKMIYERI